jgi:hypothetical protein
LLKRGAPLILDIFLHRARTSNDGFRFDYRRELGQGQWMERWKRVRVANRANRVERRYRVSDGHHVQEFVTESRQHLYSPGELEAAMAGQGFRLERGLYDYDCYVAGPESRFFTGRFVVAGPNDA